MKFLAVILLLITGAQASAQTQAPPDPMRGLVWGVPQDAVKEYEAATLVGEEDGVLVYSAMIMPDPAERSYPVMIEYRFNEDGLNRILYDMPANPGHARQALDDVMVWQVWLDHAFGQMGEPRFLFRNPNVRSDPVRWGGAIYRGEGSVHVEWLAASARARLSLAAWSGTPRITLTLSPGQSRLNP